MSKVQRRLPAFLFLLAIFSFQTGRAFATTSEGVPTIGTESDQVYFLAGAGLAIKGNTGWALDFGALTPIESGSPIFVGIDAGLNFWSSDVGVPLQSTTKTTGIQLLATGIYRFRLPEFKSVYPFIGLSVGPNIFRTTSNVAGQPTQSTVYFEALFRPGVFTNLTRSLGLGLEGKVGLIGNEFTFLPTANLVFML